MYRFNENRVFADYAADQYIVLDFVSGNYYSFDASSSSVLKALTEGCGIEDVEKVFVSRYGENCGAKEKLTTFVGRLRALEILIEEGSGPADASSFLETIDSEEMPELGFEEFSDVADLLLMDPIHEVDESIGWPLSKQDK